MLELKEETVTAIRNAVFGIHARLEKLGKKLQKDFRPDRIYNRPNVVEAIGSAIQSCENTLGALESAVDAAHAEREELTKQAEKATELEKIAGEALAQLEAVAKSR